MLVSIHKQVIFALLLLFGWSVANAQIWTLEKCISTAQAQNRTLQIAKNNRAIGEEKYKESSANLLPKITLNVDYKYFTDLPTQLLPLSTFNPTAPVGQFKEAQFGVPHNIGANLQLAIPLYNPQVYGAIQTTKVASELAALQYQKTEEQIQLEISNLYYNAQILLNQIAFLDSNTINTNRLLKNIKLLKEQQMAKGTDVSKVELQLTQLQTQKAMVNSKLQQLLYALKFVMGISLETPLQLDPAIQYSETSTYTTHNPVDLQIAHTQRKLALTDLKNTQRSLLPTLSLVGSYGTAGFGYDKKPNDFLKFFPIGFAGVQLSFPLFNGTVTMRRINQKKLELKNSELQQTNASEQNSMQIQNATLQQNVATQSIRTTEKQITQAQNIYSQTLLQQKQGLASITEVLLADATLREAQQSYLSAVVDYLKADLELKKQTGNLK